MFLSQILICFPCASAGKPGTWETYFVCENLWSPYHLWQTLGGVCHPVLVDFWKRNLVFSQLYNFFCVCKAVQRGEDEHSGPDAGFLHISETEVANSKEWHKRSLKAALKISWLGKWPQQLRPGKKYKWQREHRGQKWVIFKKNQDEVRSQEIRKKLDSCWGTELQKRALLSRFKTWNLKCSSRNIKK